MRFFFFLLVLAPLVLAFPDPLPGRAQSPPPDGSSTAPSKRDVSYTIYRYPYTTSARRYYYSLPETSWYYPSRSYYRVADGESSSPLSSVIMKPGVWREPYDGFYTGERYVSA